MTTTAPMPDAPAWLNVDALISEEERAEIAAASDQLAALIEPLRAASVRVYRALTAYERACNEKVTEQYWNIRDLLGPLSGHDVVFQWAQGIAESVLSAVGAVEDGLEDASVGPADWLADEAERRKAAGVSPTTVSGRMLARTEQARGQGVG